MATPHHSSDPRISMARLPKVLQRFLTEYTGKPLPGESPTHHSVAARTLLSLVVQIALAAVVIRLTQALIFVTSAWWAAPLLAALSIVATLAGAVVYAVRGVIAHHVAGHDNIIEDGWRKVFVKAFVEVATITWLLPAPEAYRSTHPTEHHGKRLGTPRDDDFRNLIARGLRPGQTLEWYRRWYKHESWNLRGLVKDVVANAKSHFGRSTSIRHRATAVTVWTTLVVLAIVSQHAVATAVAFVLIRLAAARSHLAQSVSEHTWSRADPYKESKDSTLTFNRLLGHPLPTPTSSARKNAVNLAVWFTKMLMTVPTRMGAAAGDLKAHHHHHERPRDDWANSAFHPVNAVEVWGSVSEWNDYTFAHLTRLPKNLWDRIPRP